MSSLFFCCKRRSKKTLNNPQDIKLDLNINNNRGKGKHIPSLEVNQSQSISMLSNNLNNSTKDNILQQRQNKFNIVNHINDNKIIIPNNNNEKYNNVIYNIINVDNINNINNNKKNIIPKGLNSINTNDKIITIKEENDELSEREKKLFEKENELSNKEKELNNKILELIQRNRKLNGEGKKQIPKNSVINDVIKFKKFVSDYEENNNQQKKSDKIDKLENKEILV